MTTRLHDRVKAALLEQRAKQDRWPNPSPTERHYSVTEVAEMWGLGQSTVRRMFGKVPGVLRLGGGINEHIRIPESILNAYHQKRLG